MLCLGGEKEMLGGLAGPGKSSMWSVLRCHRFLIQTDAR